MQSTYQDMDDIHCGSISLVATPAWSILLNLIVKGNGSRTAILISLNPSIKPVFDSLITKPEKNALIQPIMSVCGTIMAMLPFIMPIIPSIAAGSDIGLGGAWPFFS